MIMSVSSFFVASGPASLHTDFSTEIYKTKYESAPPDVSELFYNEACLFVGVPRAEDVFM